MIEAIEAVLKHWGRTLREGCPGGGLASPAGTLVEWKGCPPRTGSGGSRMLLAGAGADFLTEEVDAALAAVERQEGGALLAALAWRRYGYDPALSVDEQVRDLHLGRGGAGQQAYFRLVHRLHELVKAELLARRTATQTMVRESMRAGDRMRKASIQQAALAHAGRGAELYRGGRNDRSSGDSAPVGAVAPRQAPVRNNR